MIPRLAAVAVRLPLTFEVGGSGTKAHQQLQPQLLQHLVQPKHQHFLKSPLERDSPAYNIHQQSILGRHMLYIQATDSDG